MYQVIIVDDEPIVKIALRSMIDWNALGFHICAAASNGEEALDMAERYHPDLIICDLKMPIMDGIELIKTVQERGMSCEFLVISNYEDFNYVRTALVLGAADYILKVSISPEELTSQLNKIRDKLDKKASDQKKTTASEEAILLHQEQHAALRDFFSHKSYPLKTLESILGISPDRSETLALCHISFDWYVQEMETLPSIDLIRSTLKNVLEQLDRRRIIFFSSSNILLVISEKELHAHQTTIHALAARISQLFEYYMSLSPAILFHGNIPDMEAARHVYQHFQDLLELSFYEPLGRIDASETLLEVPEQIPDISYKELVSEILSISKEKQMEYTEQRILNLLAKCRQQYVQPSKLIHYCLRFFGELEYRVSGIDTRCHDMITDSMESMRISVNINELQKHMTNALHAVFKQEQPEDVPNPYSPEITQALDYIQENYHRKISLTSVAEHVGLSSGYLCRVFKEETDININAYINNLRMTQAGKLLKEPGNYIKEVAISVGFEDQLYFSRLFKRYYGVTPSEYRSLQKS
ncbi:MAG: response regulator [Lachnospiraceae bacterium]|nr:response regulator [Lachnospiraceae bacterium]